MNNKILFINDVLYNELLDNADELEGIAYKNPKYITDTWQDLVNNLEYIVEKLKTNPNMYIKDMHLNRLYSYMLNLINSYEGLFHLKYVEEDEWNNVLDYYNSFNLKICGINNIYCDTFDLSVYCKKTNLSANDIKKILEILNIKSDIMIFSRSKYYYQSILDNVGNIPDYLNKILKSPVFNIRGFAVDRERIEGLLNFFTQIKKMINLNREGE